MTPINPFERLVEEWLAATAPAAVPDDLHASLIRRVRRTRQHRISLPVPSRRDLTSSLRLAIDLAAVFVLAVAAINGLSLGGSGGGPVTSGGSPIPSASGAAATPVPRPGMTPETGPWGWEGDAFGPHSLAVDGITLSFDADSGGWELYRGFLISKSIVGPQGAEGVIFWSGYPDSLMASPCFDQNGPVGPSARPVARAIADMAGLEVLEQPTKVTVGGRPAYRVMMTIKGDEGCDPGYFYNWKAQTGGALWVHTQVGDRIRAWVVSVDGRLLVIGSLLSVGTPPVLVPRLEGQMQAIVDSIRFQ
jgi:hypothetical protein